MTDDDASRLELSPEAMRTLGYRVVDLLVDHFQQMPQKPATRTADRGAVRGGLNDELSEQPTPVEEVLEELQRGVFAYMGLTTHPRFFAFVPSPSNYVSVMADALASGYNAFLGNWLEAAGPHQVERIVIEWLRDLCGLEAEAGGLFVSGGSVANLTALAAARHVMLPEGVDQARAYCSDQTHSSLNRAFRVLGFADEQVVRLESDTEYCLPMQALRQRVAADRDAELRPFCVVANAGTTNTGAVDLLEELAEFCHHERLWLHVDGAYGAAAVLCDEGAQRLRGLERVDSLSIDPHKWLFQPYEIGCVLVRNWRHLFDTFNVTAEYLEDVLGEEVNFQDCGLQLTRQFRALKLWMSLKVFGLGAFRAAVRKGMETAAFTERVVCETPDLEVVTPAQLGIVTFRYAPPGVPESQLNALNKAIVARTLPEGFATVTSTVLKGRAVLRMCTINPRTSENDVRQTIERLRAAGEAAEGNGGSRRAPSSGA